jgi:hypothetical protein
MFTRATIALLSLCGAAQAANVYVMTTGAGSIAADNDNAVAAALANGGHTVTLGVPYTQFDATVDLTGIDVVYLQASWNWNIGDMPVDGQEMLFEFVRNGGGLVTNEWTVWKAAAQNTFAVLSPYFPSELDSPFSTLATMTFTQTTPEPTLNAGLPESFTFPLTSVSGTHTFIAAKPGAVGYYTFEQNGTTYDALIAAGAGCGRVANFATVNAQMQLEDENFARLLSNTMTWATLGPLVFGDATGDGEIDLADLNVVLANFGEETEDGDLDGDGLVNLADLNIVLATFGSSCAD